MIVIAVALSSVGMHVMLYWMQKSYQDTVERHYLTTIMTQTQANSERQHTMLSRMEKVLGHQELLLARKDEELRRLNILVHEFQQHTTVGNGNKVEKGKIPDAAVQRQ